jgi:hypothetical protein
MTKPQLRKFRRRQERRKAAVEAVLESVLEVIVEALPSTNALVCAGLLVSSLAEEPKAALPSSLPQTGCDYRPRSWDLRAAAASNSGELPSTVSKTFFWVAIPMIINSRSWELLFLNAWISFSRTGTASPL